MNKKYIVVSVLVVFGLVVLVWFLGPLFGIEIKSLVNLESWRFSSCGKDMAFFTESPIEMNRLTSIRPLGSLDPLGGHVFPVDHVYFFTNSQGGALNASRSGEVKVFSPGNVKVTRVAYIEYWEGDTLVDKDYSIYFKPCREAEAAFYHVKTLSSTLMSQLEGKLNLVRAGATGQHTQSRFEVKTDINLRTGELIGKAGGTFRSQALDYRMVDERIDSLTYANPDRWQKAQQHIVCPFDYYTESLKGQFMKLMGDGTKSRSESPLCGRIDQDIKGAAQGAWFAENTKETYPEDRHLSLVHDDIDPSKPVFSVGTSMEKSGFVAGKYYFDKKSTGVVNRDFNEVNERGKIYCYQGLIGKWGDKLSKVVMLELVDDNTLWMETRVGLSCVGIDRAFSDRMTVFER